MSPMGAMLGLLVAGAALLVSWWVRERRPLPVADRIGPFVGIPGHTDVRRRDLSVLAVVSASLLPRRPGPTGSQRRTGALLGGVVGLLLAALLTVDAPQPIAWAALAAVGGVVGLWSADLWSRHVRRRRDERVTAAVPLLADLLALGVSAGAGPVVVLDRAASHLDGPLAEDVDATLAHVRSGVPVETALRSLGTGSPALRRLVDAVLVCLEQGSPLGDVLRAQALDVRADERRRLLESAGRRDVTMLVPIAFLVLPTVVLIALYPGLHALHVVVP